MTIATARSLKDNDGKVVTWDMVDNFLAWEHEEAFNCNGECFDIGIATSTALDTGIP